MKTTILILALLTSTLFSGSILASVKEIKCHTPRSKKEFTIKKNLIAFHSSDSGRSLASISQVRTRRTATGFTKVISFEGHKYSIHIANSDSFSDVDDYLSIKSRKGHEITYPIECEYK